MKTIDEIKNEVAAKHGFEVWDLYEFDRQNGCNTNELIKQAMQEHAKQIAEAQRNSDLQFIVSEKCCAFSFAGVHRELERQPLVTDI